MSTTNPVIARGPPVSGTQTPTTGGAGGARPTDHIKIVAPLQGTVSVKVSEGGFVKVGDVIAVQISAKVGLSSPSINTRSEMLI